MPSKSKPFYVNGVTMSHNTLPTVAELSGEMRERLAKVKYVFTDLDATMLAPGSCALRDNDGNPSPKLVEAVVALARAGIQVVPTSGRNRTMIHEDARVLGLNSYIGEMGGLVMYDLKANDWEYLTGDMPYDPACGLTPHQVIEQTGVCTRSSTTTTCRPVTNTVRSPSACAAMCPTMRSRPSWTRPAAV